MREGLLIFGDMFASFRQSHRSLIRNLRIYILIYIYIDTHTHIWRLDMLPFVEQESDQKQYDVCNDRGVRLSFAGRSVFPRENKTECYKSKLGRLRGRSRHLHWQSALGLSRRRRCQPSKSQQHKNWLGFTLNTWRQFYTVGSASA